MKTGRLYNIKVFGCFMLIVNPFFMQAQHPGCQLKDPHNVSRAQWADFTSASIHLDFVPDSGKVVGKVQLAFEIPEAVSDSFWIDAVAMKIGKVLWDGREIGFNNSGKTLTFLPGNDMAEPGEHVVEIHYSAKPKKGMYFIGWNDTLPDANRQIWTQGQGIDNRHWFPHWDDPADKLVTETFIAFDSGYTVISNGQLVSKDHLDDGRILWHYAMRQPHPSYLVMIAIGKYEKLQQTNAYGLNLELYYYPEKERQALNTYRETAGMTEYFISRFGMEYPWMGNVYRETPVKDYMYGAMENTTSIIYRDDYLTVANERLSLDYTGVDAHEFVHQWFGDYLTARYPADHWLHESFATYYQLEWVRKVRGESEYAFLIDTYREAVFGASKKDSLPVGYSRSGTARQYFKGALILRAFASMLGKKRFDRLIETYLETYPYRNVSTGMFIDFVKRYTGKDYSWFWEQWICRYGEPEIIARVEITGKKKKRKLHINHRQEGAEGLFRIPLKTVVFYTDGDTSVHFIYPKIEEQLSVFDIPKNKEVNNVLFNPGKELPVRMSVLKPVEAWTWQAYHSPQVIDRADAVARLLNMPENHFAEDFYLLEPAWYVRLKMVRALKNDADGMALLLNDRSARVKLEAINTGGKLLPGLLESYEHCLKDSSYEVVKAALVYLALNNPGSAETYLNAVESIRDDHDHGLEMLVNGLRYLINSDSTYAKQIVRYLSDHYGVSTRLAAMRTLEQIGYFDAQYARFLIEGSFYFNRKLRVPFRKTLKNHIGISEDNKTIKKVIDLWFGEQERELVAKWIEVR